MHLTKWTSHEISSFINSCIWDFSFFTRVLSFLSYASSNNFYIRLFLLESEIFNVKLESSSLFLSLKPLTVYSTSLAVWTIKKVGLWSILGFKKSSFPLWVYRNFYKKLLSSLVFIRQLSSSKSKTPIGYLSSKSITGWLSAYLICPQYSFKPSLMKTSSSSLKT
jgi:hypothetical protein